MGAGTKLKDSRFDRTAKWLCGERGVLSLRSTSGFSPISSFVCRLLYIYLIGPLSWCLLPLKLSDSTFGIHDRVTELTSSMCNSHNMVSPSRSHRALKDRASLSRQPAWSRIAIFSKILLALRPLVGNNCGSESTPLSTDIHYLSPLPHPHPSESCILSVKSLNSLSQGQSLVTGFTQWKLAREALEQTRLLGPSFGKGSLRLFRIYQVESGRWYIVWIIWHYKILI